MLSTEIKNGRPGIDYRDSADGAYHWAYLSQVTVTRCSLKGGWPTGCPWCADENDTEDSPNLCRMHAAENEGLTEDQHERRERDEHAEWLDCHS